MGLGDPIRATKKILTSVLFGRMVRCCASTMWLRGAKVSRLAELCSNGAIRYGVLQQFEEFGVYLLRTRPRCRVLRNSVPTRPPFRWQLRVNSQRLESKQCFQRC